MRFFNPLRVSFNVAPLAGHIFGDQDDRGGNGRSDFDGRYTILDVDTPAIPLPGDLEHGTGEEPYEELPYVDIDHFEFGDEIPEVPQPEGDRDEVAVAEVGDDGRDDPDPDPEPQPQTDGDPDPAPDPIDPPDVPDEVVLDGGRPDGVVPGPPQITPPSQPPENDNGNFGRPDDAVPDIEIPLVTYTSGGPADTSYNVTIDFVGTWTNELQAGFIEAADYLSTLILGDLPDDIIGGVAFDDITITATLQGIDGVGGTLGSAGPREIRDDGSFLPSTGAMTFDVADAADQFAQGNWETIVLHEMLHAMGFGTVWSLLGLTSGSVAGGDIRFTGTNATDVYQTEFETIANGDTGSLTGIPVETDGGPGTAGGHWDEDLFGDEIMTGFIDADAFMSVMTIASLEDMGYDTVFDDVTSATDQTGPIPADPLMDLFA
ncbi:leishmanolysin-related zinc metalloendopeptidase [uncultured Tateyamaria sp.]|uniref:leishmanolysin-related zinc metalloendopeptidase n=1 Tax=uncultured Tateyamaria sp. TaxID=455651 RepID=UPI00262635C9|nr:leishmanolysin-related zinc metalloendopeptidase [uncultured Tateyamaria sp.]